MFLNPSIEHGITAGKNDHEIMLNANVCKRTGEQFRRKKLSSAINSRKTGDSFQNIVARITILLRTRNSISS